MNTHFPDCLDAPPIEEEEQQAWSWTTLDDLHPAITFEAVKGALQSFEPYKAPGPDGIQSKVLKELPDSLIHIICRLFSLCIENRYTPKCWRKNKVIFIPKPGKTDYDVPKAISHLPALTER